MGSLFDNLSKLMEKVGQNDQSAEQKFETIVAAEGAGKVANTLSEIYSSDGNDKCRSAAASKLIEVIGKFWSDRNGFLPDERSSIRDRVDEMKGSDKELLRRMSFTIEKAITKAEEGWGSQGGAVEGEGQEVVEEN